MKRRRVTPDELGRIVPAHIPVEVDHARREYVAVIGSVTYTAEFNVETEVA